MSISTLSSDLDAILYHGGVTVTYGSPVQTTYGKLENSEAQLTPGPGGFELIESSQAVVIRYGSLTGLKEDQAITVDGVSYNIRDIGTKRDDYSQRIALVEATP